MTKSEQARAEHECAGCGGRGLYNVMAPRGRNGSMIAVPCVCQACNGSGRISDRMPVADALADAETLRLVAWDAPRRHVSNSLRKTRSLGVRVVGEIEHGGGWLLPNVTAMEAARAAFRAVPGLRG